MAFLCSFLKHVPDRARAWDDGQDFRALCRRCGMPMIKDLYAGWCPVAADGNQAGRGRQRASRTLHR